MALPARPEQVCAGDGLDVVHEASVGVERHLRAGFANFARREVRLGGGRQTQPGGTRIGTPAPGSTSDRTFEHPRPSEPNRAKQATLTPPHLRPV